MMSIKSMKVVIMTMMERNLKTIQYFFLFWIILPAWWKYNLIEFFTSFNIIIFNNKVSGCNRKKFMHMTLWWVVLCRGSQPLLRAYFSSIFTNTNCTLDFVPLAYSQRIQHNLAELALLAFAWWSKWGEIRFVT